MTYPTWIYFPRNARPPEWATDMVDAVRAAKDAVHTGVPTDGPLERRTSDGVLASLRPGLETLGYVVESGKSAHQKIKRPVLFGENGRPEVSYEIDAFHDALGIAVEVEAGRGAQSNADYRDIVRTSLLLDARFLALLTPLVYRFSNGPGTTEVSAFANTRDRLSAIYASQRLKLPFEGVLLIGY